MIKRKNNYKSILLNITCHTFDLVDIVATEQNVTITAFLRQSIERNLNHYEKHEKPHFQHMYRQGMS